MSARMSKLLLLLLLRLVNAQQCSRQIELRPNQPHQITSANFPNPLPAGSNCKYQLKAPNNHVIHITCRFELYPDNCQLNLLFMSLDGDMLFRAAEQFCRSTTMTRRSNFQSLALAYQSTNAATRQRARLRCNAVARPVACDCGWSDTMRISNGTAAAKHEFPSMVGLRDRNSNVKIFCGGSIISDKYILTAAHCMVLQPVARNILALLGDHDLNSNAESIFASHYDIRNIIIHPQYVSSTDLNDMALLQTIKSMEWSRGIAPICLPFRSAQNEALANVEIAGWGTKGFTAATSNILLKAELRTISNAKCSARYNATIASSLVCTEDVLGYSRDACQYDSGGPVIQRQRGRMFLVGVISTGRPCGGRYSIGINTRVSSQFNWIWSYVRGSVCQR